jgi:hypothetical protein
MIATENSRWRPFRPPSPLDAERAPDGLASGASAMPHGPANLHTHSGDHPPAQAHSGAKVRRRLANTIFLSPSVRGQINHYHRLTHGRWPC